MVYKDLMTLLQEWDTRVEATSIDIDVAFSHITEDSRNVTPESLFVAIAGEHVRGVDYIHAAIEHGAVAILGEYDSIDNDSVPYIKVPHAREALGRIAHALAGNPSHALTVIGATGTNGKSSTVLMIQHILQHAGHPTACLGTLGYVVGGTEHEAALTTPFPETLARLFAEARDAGDTHVVMEVSSHSLEQERVAGIEFDVAVFTNLTQDHLDYHKDMDTYLGEKIKLFKKLNADSGIAITNADDPYGHSMKDATEARHISFGKGSDVRASDIKMDGNRTHFMLETLWGNGACDMGLLGRHNVSNALAAVSVCGALGVSIEDIQRSLKTMPAIPGRFECIDAGQDFQVVVDYAHTDDGLRNVLQAAREICDKRVIVVFGCGGDRDKTKRSKMASVAAELSDYSIITSDNPRTESPELILMDVEVGMQHAGKKRNEEYIVLENREEAIHAGLSMAQAGDLVLIAGKGHEDYQILSDGKIHFDDREVARTWLEKQS